MMLAMIRSLFALIVLLGTLPVFAGDVAAPPDQIQQAKIIEWGWHTPPTPYVREHIREMEKMPFDGVVLTLTANGMHDLSKQVARQHTFPACDFGADPLDPGEYSESIDALSRTQFKKFTDNFLRMNVSPGDRDWFDESHFGAAANAAMLAKVVKQCHLKGIVLDTEAYGGQIFNSKLQPQTKQHTLAEYREQVRKQGRKFMRAINDVDPQTTLLITLAYSMAHFPDENAQKYQLLPDFLDGILEEAAPGQVIYDGWEWAYNFTTEKQFADTRKIIREKELTWTAVPEAMKKHWRAGFGIWLDYGAHWDARDFSKNFFSPAQFAYSVHEGLKYTDRYVWIWSQAPSWWDGSMPEPYVEALRQARQEELAAPANPGG
jgi:hypothetical protein